MVGQLIISVSETVALFTFSSAIARQHTAFATADSAVARRAGLSGASKRVAFTV